MDEIREKLHEGVPVLGGRYRLKVSPDGLCAYLEPAEENVGPPDEEALSELKEFLKTQGIVYGLLDRPLWEGDRLILARGKAPVPGKDGYLELLVKPKKEEADQLKVDLRERGLVRCVKKGQELGRLHPPTPGVPGRDVFGREVPAPPGKEFRVKTNEFVSFEPKEGLFRAKEAGVFEATPSELKVLPRYQLQGDLGWETGNVRFVGEKLLIGGHVKRGFRLSAEGDVEIEGNVEDEAEVEVRGNLIIKGLVFGEAARVRVEGEAEIGAIEYATVQVGKDLIVKDYILQARVQVVGDVTCTEGIGAIVGGEVAAEGSIFLHTAGSRAQVSTWLKAGHPARLLERLEELKMKLLLLEEEKRPLVKVLRSTLNRLKENPSPEKVKACEKLGQKLKKLLSEEERLRKEKKALLARIKEMTHQKVVKVSKRVFVGVKIQIGLRTFTVAEDLPAGTFCLPKEQIRFIPERGAR